MVRRNQVIQKLIDGETVLSTIPIGSANFNDMIQLAESNFDMVMVEMEHSGFDFQNLRTSFQYLISRRKVIEKGIVVDPTPFVRLPANTREKNEWIIKQALDAGAMGLVLPHFDTVEGAQAAVNAARYPAARGSDRHPDPAGVRGFDFGAAQYWGMGAFEYVDAAGIWPLDPDGEIILMGIVETVAGVKALPDILSKVKGVGAVWAGQGDLSISMGLRDVAHPEVELELLKILKIANEHGVACATAVTGAADAAKRIDQGFQIVLISTRMDFEQLNKATAKLGR